jgi:hypothetical protein
MNETWMIIKMITGFNLNHGVFRGELAWVLRVSGFAQQCDWEFSYSGVWHWIAGQVVPCILQALFSHEVLGSTASNTALHYRRQNPSSDLCFCWTCVYRAICRYLEHITNKYTMNLILNFN